LATTKKTAKKTMTKKAAKTAYVHDTVTGLILILVAVLISISLVSDLIGPFGKIIQAGLLGLFGAGSILFPVLLIYSAVLLFMKNNKVVSKSVFSTLFIVMFSSFYNICVYTAPKMDGSVFSDYFSKITIELWENGSTLSSGGVIGGWVSLPLEALCAKLGSGIIIFAAMAVFLVLATGINPMMFFEGHGEYPEEKKNVKTDKAISKDIKGLRKDIDDLKKTLPKEPTIIPEKESRKKPMLVLEKEEKPKDDDVDSILNEITRGYKEKNARTAKNRKPVPVRSDNTAALTQKDLDEIISRSNPKPAPTVHKEEKPTVEQIATQVEEIIEKKPTEEPVVSVAEEQPAFVEAVIPETEENVKPEEIKEADKAEEALDGATVEIIEQKEPTELIQKKADGYKFPPMDILSFVPDNNAALYRDELKQNAARLIETLSDFKINAKVLDAKRGPTVTRYELQPGTGVKTSKIANLSDDIALHLAAPAVRIEAPIPGKSAIGIEIPNKTTSTVYLKEIVGSEEFASHKSKISVALGKSISGQPMVIDIAKMPHLLIAGATGSGKSVCINSILISLLYKATPDEVKLILVDPKVVELNIYNGIPHLLIPVVTDPSKAAGALSWAVGEMLQRYKMFADKNVRNFNGYNDSLIEGEKKLPQIVIVIDELADLMMTAKGDVEDSICRLAQMGRAAGIHLVIATQRPSADVITGLIKANVPSRIAFAVSSAINSHIILDASGAEKLIGKGDMLYSPLGEVKPIRVQGCFVSDQEVEKAVKAVKNGKESTYDDSILKQIEQNAAMQKAGAKGGASDDEEEVDDPKLDEAIQCVVEKGQASTTMLQKFVGLGYVRASKLIDVMEARGIVGPYQGSTPREVLITKAQWQEMKARKQD